MLRKIALICKKKELEVALSGHSPRVCEYEATFDS